MKQLALAIAFLIATVATALAQSVTVIGTVTPGNIPQFNSQTVVKDSGVAGGSALFANPTGAVGLTAVPGSATTAMRSDAAPPLSTSVQSALTGTNNGVALKVVQHKRDLSASARTRPNSIWRNKIRAWTH